ncbi:FecR domain-containing protein [Pseudomonas sp. ABC1]|uniref:FecR domain-containing protein n=1 Tax=Pseudomonas sp. ABC1 TaxID=2748080 RepID=UPI0015C331C7|nr:FecR domain-containing protein [Pseudomonas sp. ABC1]QLF94185.1 FecR domain-containing protein [Pseudomonas sp. ABC1]
MKAEPIAPEIAQRAVEWLVELQSSAADESTHQALRRWREADPRHERAWQRIEAFHGRFSSLDTPTRQTLSTAAQAPAHSPERRQAIRTLAVLLFAGGTAWGLREHTPWPAWTADLRTGTGQRTRMELADGSVLQLNSGSAVDVRYDARQRCIHLHEGEILVETAPDAAGRPFLVQCRDGRAQALGTRFSLRQWPDDSLLAVHEGAVAVYPALQQDSRRVNSGEQLRFDRQGWGESSAVRPGDLAWLQGMLVADGMRLADLLGELQRHRPGRLTCAEAVADLRVSGTYPLENTDRAIETLASTLGLRSRYFTRYWVSLEPSA